MNEKHEVQTQLTREDEPRDAQAPTDGEAPSRDESLAPREGRTQRARARLALKLSTLAVSLVAVAVVTLGSLASSKRNELPPLRAKVPGADFNIPFEPESQAANDFSKFSHTNPMHARLPCLLCHRRETNSTTPVRSLGHTPCAGCHAQQFSDSHSPICTICHTNTDSAKPPLKPFPKLQTFGVAFDHASHTAGRANCATCHRPSGRGLAALSIPSGGAAHATCFKCHTPDAVARDGHDISSCGNCHRLGRTPLAPAWSSAYTTTPFSHASHTRKGLSCAECHTVRSGAPLARQVAAPFPAQHHAPAGTRSCASCHDGKRAFGGEDFNDCTRCHRGNAWHF
jgi:c(7)-type cytochrome triheme protein